MNPGDIVKVMWGDGEVAIGKFLRFERGFAVFETHDEEKIQFVAMVGREYTKTEIITSAKIDKNLDNL